MKITIYGLGALGSNLLLQLARQYPDFEYVGIDDDSVEERNIRTQVYFLEHVGMFKGDAMRVVLGRYLRKTKYASRKHRVLPGDRIRHVGDGELGIDCFDNSVSRKVIANGEGNILHAGFSPLYTAECIWNEDYDVPGDVDSKAGDFCQMPNALAFIHFVVSRISLSVSEYLDRQKKQNFIVTQSKITTI